MGLARSATGRHVRGAPRAIRRDREDRLIYELWRRKLFVVSGLVGGSKDGGTPFERGNARSAAPLYLENRRTFLDHMVNHH